MHGDDLKEKVDDNIINNEEDIKYLSSRLKVFKIANRLHLFCSLINGLSIVYLLTNQISSLESTITMYSMLVLGSVYPVLNKFAQWILTALVMIDIFTIVNLFIIINLIHSTMMHHRPLGHFEYMLGRLGRLRIIYLLAGISRMLFMPINIFCNMIVIGKLLIYLRIASIWGYIAQERMKYTMSLLCELVLICVLFCSSYLVHSFQNRIKESIKSNPASSLEYGSGVHINMNRFQNSVRKY